MAGKGIKLLVLRRKDDARNTAAALGYLVLRPSGKFQEKHPFNRNNAQKMIVNDSARDLMFFSLNTVYKC
jgi:hypothetical protein